MSTTKPKTEKKPITSVDTNQPKLVDLAYMLAQAKYKQKIFSFSEIWDALKKKYKDLTSNPESYVDFFVSIQQDPRFIIISSEKLRLREYATVEEFNKVMNSKYSKVEFDEPEVDESNEEITESIEDNPEYAEDSENNAEYGPETDNDSDNFDADSKDQDDSTFSDDENNDSGDNNE
ncbi:hypothetical protein J6P04_01440 [bacterium]|nr:hypothetical protein [bacterium]